MPRRHRLSWYGRALRLAAAAVLAALGLDPAPAAAQQAPPPGLHQFGTTAADAGLSVAVDPAGNVYVGGSTAGSLGGANAGRHDAFLRRYNADGTIAWTRQFGTAGSDAVLDVAVDAAGNAYVGGFTGGRGTTDIGETSLFRYGSQALLRRYNADGSVAWTQQFGAIDANAVNDAAGVAVDGAGQVYVTGALGFEQAEGRGDTYLRRYRAVDGALAWEAAGVANRDQGDRGTSVAVTATGRVTVAGWRDDYTTAFDYDQPFIYQYAADGTRTWQWGLIDDTETYLDHTSVTHDGQGNAYATWDNKVARYGPNGGLVWMKQFDGPRFPVGRDIVADAAGNLYVIGGTSSGDVMLLKYNSNGTLLWSRPFGTAASDLGYGVDVDALGNLYVTGLTGGDLAGPSAGGTDAFVTAPVPEPTSAAVIATALGAVALAARRRRGKSMG